MSVLPHTVLKAARTLYAYSDEFRERLGTMINQTSDQCIVNPRIKAHHTLDTGSCIIYVSEVMPLSLYLYYMAKDATYSLQVVPNSRPLEVSFSNASVKTWSGRDGPVKSQSFDCGDRNEDEYAIVEEYVERLGILDPEEAVQYEFLRGHVEGVIQALHAKRARY